jgi:hypothetical protein
MAIPNIDPSMSTEQLMSLSNLPYTPPKAPDKVSEQDLEGIERKRLWEMASYDPEQDPKVQAGRALSDKYTNQAFQRVERGMGMADEQERFMQQNRPGPAPIQSEAPKFAETAKSLSPWLLIGTQIFGGAMGASANSMLGAMKGQLDGLNQNNIDAHNRAVDEWEKHWNTLKTNWDNKNLVYQQGLDWFKGRVDAEMRAATLAEEAAGMGEKMVGNALQRHQAGKEVMSALDAYHKVLQGHADRARASNEKDWNKLLGGKNEAYSSAMKFKKTADDLKTAWDKVVAKVNSNPELKQLIDAGAITGSALVQKINTVASEELAEFQVKAGNEFSQQFRYNIAGIPGSSLRLKSTVEAEMKNMPDLRAGFLQTGKAVQNAVDLANDAIDLTAKEYNDLATRHLQGGPMYVPGVPGAEKTTPAKQDVPSPTAEDRAWGKKSPANAAKFKERFGVDP